MTAVRRAQAAPSKLKMSVRPAGREEKRPKQATPAVAKHMERESSEWDDDVEDAGDDGVDDDDDDNDDDDNDDDEAEDNDSDSHEDMPAQDGRSKKTMKRKRRAVSPGAFGDALEHLLSADAERPAGRDGVLSLAPSVRRTANATTLRAKAARLALEKRRQREERAHIKDVFGEWGPPGATVATAHDDDAKWEAWMQEGGTKGYERRLRKTAQRGGTFAFCLTAVVKLFNAIRAAQSTTEDDIDKARALQTTKQARKINSLGSKDQAGTCQRLTSVKQLSKSHFLELLRQPAKTPSAASDA